MFSPRVVASKSKPELSQCRIPAPPPRHETHSMQEKFKKLSESAVDTQSLLGRMVAEYSNTRILE